MLNSTNSTMRTTDLGFPEFVWIWNSVQKIDTPALHVRMARWLEARWLAGDRSLLILAFRSSGKSTLVALFSAWLLLRDNNLRILTLSADFALAAKMVRNVKRIIELHPFTSRLKPRKPEQWAANQFTVQRTAELRDPSMLAKSIESNITGLRADVVLCDDVEVPNTCYSRIKRAALREHLREIQYVLNPGGLQLYIGTPHTYYSIYSDTAEHDGDDQPFLQQFERLEIPIFDADGNSQWPERFSRSKIEQIYAQSGPNKFESQMLLRPVNIARSRLNIDLLRPYTDELLYQERNREVTLTLGGRRLVSSSCWWDPALGRPTTGDASVIACVFTDEIGVYWLHRIRYLEYDPDDLKNVDEATQHCRQVCDFITDFYLPSVSIETNGIGGFLPGLLRREIATRGICCSVVERTSRTQKDMRIVEAFDAVMAAGHLHAHEDVWRTPFIEEMREWVPGVRNRDDGLDAVAGCLSCEPVRLPRLFAPRTALNAPNRRWRPDQTTHAASIEFQP